MPIEIDAQLRTVSQDVFSRVAYNAMSVFFAVHKELGTLFHEGIYKRAVAERHGQIETEVPVRVSFGEFRKTYFLDMLVGGCAVFEAKTARSLSPSHRAQLVNYLFLTELSHGKLVNLRPEKIEHEFVNALMSRGERTNFVVEDERWHPHSAQDTYWKQWLIDALRDWGVGLDVNLYVDAVTHCLGGPDKTKQHIAVNVDGQVVGTQEVLLTGEGSILNITAYHRVPTLLECQFMKFLRHTPLGAIHWVNISRTHVAFCTLLNDA